MREFIVWWLVLQVMRIDHTADHTRLLRFCPTAAIPLPARWAAAERLLFWVLGGWACCPFGGQCVFVVVCWPWSPACLVPRGRGLWAGCGRGGV
jgi:hypothetical protein